MQRARRMPVAGRGLLALATCALFALAGLFGPAGAASAATSSAVRLVGAPAPVGAPLAGRHQRTGTSVTSRARSCPASSVSSPVSSGATAAGRPVDSGPLHPLATAPSRLVLDVPSAPAGLRDQQAHPRTARPDPATPSRAPPTGH